MLHKLAVSFHQSTLSTAFSPRSTHTRAHTLRRTLATPLRGFFFFFSPHPELIHYTWAGILELNEALNGNYIPPPVTPPISNLASNCPNCLTPFLTSSTFPVSLSFFFSSPLIAQTLPAPAHIFLSLCVCPRGEIMAELMRATAHATQSQNDSVTPLPQRYDLFLLPLLPDHLLHPLFFLHTYFPYSLFFLSFLTVSPFKRSYTQNSAD